MELKMELSQKQVLSQHMVQSMEILQMSAQELEGYIEKLALENPVIELADLQGMELESLSDGKFSFSYPAEDWEVWEQVTTDYHPLTIFYKGTADDGSTSISVAENDTVVTQLKPELLQVMLDGLKEQAPYMVIKESEMRSMEGTPVFYLEDNMSLTQEGLDMMVDTGAWTEETIEAMGGREAL